MNRNRMKLFEKFNKNRVDCFDINIHDDATGSLWALIQEENVDMNSPKLREFVKKFFAYKQQIELEKEYVISVLSSGILRKNLITLLKQKKLLQKLDQIYTNLCLFHFEFYNTFGVSLTRTQAAIDNEISLKIS